MEFMLLSKHINNLHINNGMLLDQSVGRLGAEWGRMSHGVGSRDVPELVMQCVYSGLRIVKPLFYIYPTDCAALNMLKIKIRMLC